MADNAFTDSSWLTNIVLESFVLRFSNRLTHKSFIAIDTTIPPHWTFILGLIFDLSSGHQYHSLLTYLSNSFSPHSRHPCTIYRLFNHDLPY